MRYRFAVLMLLLLLVVLMLHTMPPVVDVLAAPAPEPAYAILDIGPPPEGMTADEYRKRYIDYLTTMCPYDARHDPKVKELPSVVNSKAHRLWLEKNLRVTPEKGDRTLRLTFRAGKRTEQVAILNSVLGIYLRDVKGGSIHFHEANLRREENHILELERRIQSGRYPGMVDTFRTEIKVLRSDRIPAWRAEIDRDKQIAVIKWAK